MQLTPVLACFYAVSGVPEVTIINLMEMATIGISPMGKG